MDDAAPNPQHDALRAITLYVMIPGWIVPGALDWWWHRRSKIEETAGARESLIHAVMMTEIGVPILASLFLEIDAGVLLGMAGAVVLHELTAMWDVLYATPRRAVLPREQHTHSFLEVLPFAAAAAAAALHPHQARALFGFGPERPEFRWRRKSDRLPAPYVATLLGVIALFIALPYGEELVRCLRVRRTFRARRPPSESPLAAQQRWAHDTRAEGFE